MINKTNYAKWMAETVRKRYPRAEEFPGDVWEYSHGYLLMGFIKLWEYTGEKIYYDYAMDFVSRQVTEEGDIQGFNGKSLDNMLTGAVLVWAYKNNPQERFQLACEKIRGAFRTYPRNPDGGFWHADWAPHQMWVDGLFMGPMFLLAYGLQWQDEECLEEIQRQFELIYLKCRKKDTGLLYHAWSSPEYADWADAQTGCSPEVWSEGLGWYAISLTEIMEKMPEGHPLKEKMKGQYLALLESLLECQDKENGLWYQVVDKGAEKGNWQDSSGSAMFLYALAKAADMGFLEKEKISSSLRLAYEGLKKRCQETEEGFLDLYHACDGLCVQKSYEVYVGYPQIVNAKEAVASFLWASAYMEYRF